MLLSLKSKEPKEEKSRPREKYKRPYNVNKTHENVRKIRCHRLINKYIEHPISIKLFS